MQQAVGRALLALRGLSPLVKTGVVELLPIALRTDSSAYQPTLVSWSGQAFSSKAEPLVETRSAWNPQAQASQHAQEPSTNTEPQRERQAGGASASDLIADEVAAVLTGLGVKPGRDCVVGGGLAVVDLGLFLDGVQVALDIDHSPPQTGMLGTGGAAGDARSYALSRARQRVLQAHGWHLVTLSADAWRRLDSEDGRRQYLASTINSALSGQGGHNHHHGHSHGHSHSHQGGCCGGGDHHGHEHHEDHEDGHHGSGGGGGGCGGGGCGHKH